MLREPHMGATRLAISPPRARREDVVDVGQAVQFQSTRRKERDSQLLLVVCKYQVFQSTRPMGATVFAGVVNWRYQFQSTRPHGATPARLSGRQLSQVSIHAPAWGATPRP